MEATLENPDEAATEDEPAAYDEDPAGTEEDAEPTTEDDGAPPYDDEPAGAEEEAGAAAEELLLPPVGEPPDRTQPVLSVSALGQVTSFQSTVGLSAPSKKLPKRKLQPGWRADGKEEQVLDEMPPYWAPHPDAGAPHSSVQPLSRERSISIHTSQLFCSKR